MKRRVDTLATDRLLLRRARPGDLAAVHRIMSDAETMRYWSTAPHESIEQTRLWLDSMLAAAPGGSDEFVLEYEGELIGKMGAWRLPEIGFFLRRDHWGKGLASEALDAFARYIADEGATHLTADVDPRNIPCLALLARAGFRETGRARATFIVHGMPCDSVYLRLDLCAD